MQARRSKHAASTQEQVTMHTIYAPTVMSEICIPQHENKSLPWPDPTQLSGWSLPSV